MINYAYVIFIRYSENKGNIKKKFFNILQHTYFSDILEIGKNKKIKINERNFFIFFDIYRIKNRTRTSVFDCYICAAHHQ